MSDILSTPKTNAYCTAALDKRFYDYLLDHIGESEVQRRLRKDADTLAQANMSASADEYQLLGWLCETIGATRVIEVGVFRGLTTLAIAKRLPPNGIIRALDISKELADIGIKAWKAEGVDRKIDFIEGPAVESMKKLIADGEAGTYDMIFIDANKNQYVEYYELAVQLVRKGGVIVVDNTLFHGGVIAPIAEIPKEFTEPVRELNEVIKHDTRVSAVMSIIADGVYFVRKL